MTRRLRLLMTADAVGGVWTYALDLAAGLAPHGVETTLAVLGPDPTPDQVAAAARVPKLDLVPTRLPLEWLAVSAMAVVESGRALAALARETGADMVQLNAPGPAAEAVFPAPVAIACHSCLATWWRAVRGGAVPEDFAWRIDLVARAYRSGAQLVAPSASFAAATRQAYALPTAPQVVHNARLAREAAAPPAQLPSLAFTAGRLWDEGKAVAVIDRAAARVPFAILAAGPLAGPNGARIALSHLRLLGRLSDGDIARWLALRPIFVSMARYEPFGLAVLEAAQAGCALVLADTPGFRELWGPAAAFVPPGDDAALAATLQALETEPGRRAALGAAAARRARRYDPDRQAAAMLAIYERARQGRDVAA